MFPLLKPAVLVASLALVASQVLGQAKPDWNDQTSIGPMVRHAVAYDAARARTVLFGGGQTWLWNGTSWFQRALTNSPTARSDHAMVYDEARCRVVLFGGIVSASGLSAETWEWDGNSWLQRTPSVSPSARYSHSMAYDSARRKVVLFAGETGRAGRPETWEWDGRNWQHRFPTQSPSFRHSCMAYDTGRRVCVVQGQSQTWEWDGSNWRRRTPAQTPREVSTMAYDPVRKRIVAYWADTFSTKASQTWEWDGTSWRQVASRAGPSARFP